MGAILLTLLFYVALCLSVAFIWDIITDMILLSMSKKTSIKLNWFFLSFLGILWSVLFLCNHLER